MHIFGRDINPVSRVIRRFEVDLPEAVNYLSFSLNYSFNTQVVTLPLMTDEFLSYISVTMIAKRFFL